MKIGINSTYLSKMRKTGVENYSSSAILHLLKNDHKNLYTLYSQLPLPASVIKNYPKANIQISKFPKGWHSIRLPLEIKHHPVDIFFDPGYTIPPFCKASSIATVHDLAHKYFPEAYSKTQIRSLELGFKRLEKSAHGIVFTSNNTKNDFLKYYPGYQGKSIVIYQSIEKDRFYPDTDSVQDSRFIGVKYILSVGRLEKRKNTINLIKAYAQFKKQHPEFSHKLVLAGTPGYKYDEIKRIIVENPNLANDIIEIGYIEDKQMPSLYTNASLFVFPSLFEGFGIPILEAFAAKVPVVCSNASSLPEVAAKACMYFNPANINEIATKIFDVLNNSGIQKDLVEKGTERLNKFDWDDFSYKLINFFKEVYESCHNS